MKKSHKLSFILLIFGILIGISLTIFGFLKKDYIVLQYQEDNSVSYKVFLKPNDYFETSYLGENRTYIATLIDYLDIDFQYLVNFSDKITGNCNYYIKATISANKPNRESGYYWQKEFKLTNPKRVSVLDNK